MPSRRQNTKSQKKTLRSRNNRNKRSTLRQKNRRVNRKNKSRSLRQKRRQQGGTCNPDLRRYPYMISVDKMVEEMYEYSDHVYANIKYV